MNFLEKWFASFSIKVFLKKWLKRGVQILVAYLVAKATSDEALAIGITVDEATLEQFLMGTVWTGLEALRQIVKTNNPGWAWI